MLGAALVLGGLCVGAPFVGPRTVLAAPEPSPVPLRWQLDVKPGALRLALVEVEGVGPRAFFYMTYDVVNNTGQDLYFAPSFELTTDEGEAIRAGADVPARVARKILEDLKRPLMVDQTDAIGTLRQGPENGRESVVVWPARNLKADRVTIYAQGFSGETKRVRRPDAAPEESKDSAEVTLRKTLMLEHATPGEISEERRPLARVSSRWIMR